MSKELWSSQLKISFSISCNVLVCSHKLQKQNKKREVSYFQLTKDTSIHKDWIHATGCPVDNLPSKILIYSDHFEDKCFDPNWKLQNELYYKDPQISRRLLLGPIPTLLKLVYLQRREHWHKERKS